MGSEGEEPSHHKVDRRKKRTSSSQYMMYIEMMEDDPIFAGGRLTRDVDINYLPKRWRELAVKLNTCSTGPKLTAEEWRKRLNDWKNTTRCKYRRKISGEKDITLTSLEMKALELFGKTAPVNTTAVDHLSIQLKDEKPDIEHDHENPRSSETLQKQLQAAVDEAIRGNENDEDDEDVMQDEAEEHEMITMSTNRSAHIDDGGGGGGGISSNRGNLNATGIGSIQGGSTTTYRTIVVENSSQYDEDNAEEFITHRRPSMVNTSPAGTATQTVVSTSNPGTTVTKLINGDIPLKRLRSQAPEQIIYEVKKAPVAQRTIMVHSTPTTQYQTINQSQQQQQQQQQQQHQQQQQQQQQQHRTIDVVNNYATSSNPAGSVITSQDAREIARQLKRLADIKAEKLKFDVARFKFNNPGFHFNLHL